MSNREANPPAPFPNVNCIIVPVSMNLHRIHDEAFAATSFNPGTGSSQSRFAPTKTGSGSPIPTLYSATSFECAAHETIFHDIVPNAELKTVPFTRLKPLKHSILRLRRDVKLATLYEPDLNAWGISRKDLIDTLPAEYPRTARWAEAIHASARDIAGLVWTSRRCDPDQAFMFFGDRIAESEFDEVGSVKITADDETLQHINRFAERAKITITL